MSIKDNIEYINRRKEKAALKSGRTGDDVLLVAVTKLHTAAEMNEAIDAGITDIAENKVQEIVRKYDHRKKISLHLVTGEDMELSHDAESAERICMLMKEGKVETIHSSEPDLETVFLELTGRKLEEVC